MQEKHIFFSLILTKAELVNLDIADVDFEERECIVYGKGDKERRVYFDARTKLHLQNYLEKRQDDNQALFVTLSKPYNRLKISGVEIRLRELGRRLNIDRVHHINLGGQWQPELLIRECQLNRFRNY